MLQDRKAIEETYAKTSGGDQAARMAPPVMLRSPHLVLSDTRCDDHILLAMRRLAVELLDNLLRLHHRARLVRALLIRERVLRLPALDIIEPLRARRRADQGHKRRHVRNNIAEHGDGRLDDLVDVFRLDLEVDDAPAALGSRRPRGRRELADLARHAVIEARAQRDDHVRLLHRQVRVRGPVHAEHVEALLVQLVERAEALQRRRHRDVALLRELPEQLWAEGGREDAVAGVDDRPLRLVDQVRGLLDHEHVRGLTGRLQGI